MQQQRLALMQEANDHYEHAHGQVIGTAEQTLHAEYLQLQQAHNELQQYRERERLSMQVFEREKAAFEQTQCADEAIKQQQTQQLQTGRTLHVATESSGAELSSLRNELNQAGGNAVALRQEIETYKHQIAGFQRGIADA